ncbi:MAG TPA: hypothetical protein VGW10_15555 [Solirubrobacteraceae bacterium]|nr:hypothetical protein [Solirubrobacteraceae bacterium]
MSRLLGRRAHFDALAAAVADPAGLAALHVDAEVPQPVAQWLRQLALLRDVPFGHLVPDEAMLPPESIRFFALDRRWVDALVDGACSIGRVSAADAAHDAALAAALHEAAAAPAVATGFLLRSAVVTDWPRLAIEAYDAAGARLGEPPLRQETVAPATLLYLVAGEIDRLALREPAESLHFGADATGGRKALRWVTVPPGGPPEARPGDVVRDTPGPAVPLRAGGRVVRVDRLAQEVRAGVDGAHANDGRPFTPAELALQLVEGAQVVRFGRAPRGKGG